MDERWYLDVISGRKAGPTATITRAGLSLLTPGYRLAVGIRNLLYDVSVKRSHEVGVPVVSVGNLTTGGTGKTPMVAWFADWFQSQGKQPAIVSRGYRSLEAGDNDEYRVLEQLCPNVPHEQDRDRVAGAQRVARNHSPDAIILDDGFQHRRLARDVDIILIDALNPWGYGRLLPRGLLREPKSLLQRADAVVITRVDQMNDDRREHLKAEIRCFTQAHIAEVAFRPTKLVNAAGETASLDGLLKQALHAFCGIGNPAGFQATLQAANFENVTMDTFPDHHHYTPDDVKGIEARAAKSHAKALVTTQKDLVKLDPAWLTMPVWAVVIGVDFLSGLEGLKGILSKCLQSDH